ncbi:FUSC family protein [Nocardia flavorosea]|uniref:FUSC family protein n=1 Tax=Nocardia flavorosea TaxID=53429 RepID=UPI001895E4EE|nr:FUSC family protein [Nocardia flavorosea]MBF6352133.1 FUSC family protein [Nocardia flavorosea]
MVAPEGPKIPSPAPARSALFGVPPAGRRLPGAVRAAVAFGAPALVAVALGHEQQGLMAATGALAVIFGEGQVYRRRVRVIGAAALSLVLTAFAGGLTGELIQTRLAAGGSHWWQLSLVVLMSAVAVAGTFVNSALRLGPPGGFFFVLAAGVGALITGHGVPPGEVALWTAIGGLSALIVGMSAALTRADPPEQRAVTAAAAAVRDYAALDPAAGDTIGARYATAMKVQTAWALLDDARRTDSTDGLVDELTRAQRAFAGALHRDNAADNASDLLFDTGRPAPTPRPTLRYRLLRSVSPDSHAAVSANRIAIATLLAGGLTVALDLGRPDWAVVTVTVLLHQGPDRVRGTYRGVHRIGGTALGLVLFTGLYALEPGPWSLVLILMTLQFAIETFVARNYGLAVVFITALALLMGGGGQYGDMVPVVRDRLVESAIGVLIGLAALWSIDRRAHRRVLLRNDQRVLEALGRLLRLLALPARQRTALPEVRRELEFELMGSTLGAIDAAHNEPEWTRTHWIRHQRIRRLGHHVLAADLYPDSPVDPGLLSGWSRNLAELA